MTEQEANERIALLLGWRQHEMMGLVSWMPPPNPELAWQLRHDNTPDFSQWDRFQEQLTLVDGLDRETQDRIFDICFPLHESIRRELWRITPTVLRDAILAVVGEEAEVTSG